VPSDPCAVSYANMIASGVSRQ